MRRMSPFAIAGAASLVLLAPRRSAESQAVADLPIGARGGLRHHGATARDIEPSSSTVARPFGTRCRRLNPPFGRVRRYSSHRKPGRNEIHLDPLVRLPKPIRSELRLDPLEAGDERCARENSLILIPVASTFSTRACSARAMASPAPFRPLPPCQALPGWHAPLGLEASSTAWLSLSTTVVGAAGEQSDKLPLTHHPGFSMVGVPQLCQRTSLVTASAWLTFLNGGAARTGAKDHLDAPEHVRDRRSSTL
jgi:hypothetical protein